MPRRENDHVTWTLPSGANGFQRYKHDVELPLVADHDAVAARQKQKGKPVSFSCLEGYLALAMPQSRDL
jgi:hypothetical protein